MWILSFWKLYTENISIIFRIIKIIARDNNLSQIQFLIVKSSINFLSISLLDTSTF